MTKYNFTIFYAKVKAGKAIFVTAERFTFQPVLAVAHGG